MINRKWNPLWPNSTNCLKVWAKLRKLPSIPVFFSEHNTNCFEAKGIEPYITSGRHAHNRSLEERLAPPPSPPQNSDAVAAMKHRLKTEAGKQFYAKRQSTVEPVFGIIKEVMGFRRFMLRGFEAVTGEWTRFVYCLQFEASLHPQCVNNRRSASKIRSVAIVMTLDQSR